MAGILSVPPIADNALLRPAPGGAGLQARLNRLAVPAAVRRNVGVAVLTDALAYDSWPIPSVTMLQRAGSAIERLATAAL